MNSRNLDVRFRLPPGHDKFEPQGRSAAEQRFARGSVSVQLALKRQDSARSYRINQAMLEDLIKMVSELKGRGKLPPQPELLLTLPGVIEFVEEEESDAARDEREAALTATLLEVLDALAAARNEEGGRLLAIISEQIAELERLCAEARQTAGAQPEAIHQRLREQIETLLSGDNPVTEERLAQEAALLATRADIREELDRLTAHLQSAREIIEAGGPVGRRLDFLCQELNREANTLCSKSSDLDLTRIGLDLKAVVDRLREQVQNIE